MHVQEVLGSIYVFDVYMRIMNAKRVEDEWHKICMLNIKIQDMVLCPFVVRSTGEVRQGQDGNDDEDVLQHVIQQVSALIQEAANLKNKSTVFSS